MDIAITGSSGLIGSALARDLEADGHRIIPIVRSHGRPDAITWDIDAGTIEADKLEGLDAVVHLAGEPIAAGPWTKAQRTKIRASRTDGTSLLAKALAELDRPPAVMVSGSAIGYYGDAGDRELSESAPAGDDFLAEICQAWEAAAEPARAAAIRVVAIRTGIVLDPAGGALAKQLPIFKLGLGGKAGRGDQWMAWITLRDEVRAIRFALETATLEGPVNLTAPQPVTNAAFTKALGAALGRPTFVRVPALARHAPFGVGDLVDSLLFTSARVVPDALLDAGFTFEDQDIDEALTHLVGSG